MRKFETASGNESATRALAFPFAVCTLFVHLVSGNQFVQFRWCNSGGVNFSTLLGDLFNSSAYNSSDMSTVVSSNCKFTCRSSPLQRCCECCIVLSSFWVPWLEHRDHVMCVNWNDLELLIGFPLIIHAILLGGSENCVDLVP